MKYSNFFIFVMVCSIIQEETGAQIIPAEELKSLLVAFDMPNSIDKWMCIIERVSARDVILSTARGFGLLQIPKMFCDGSLSSSEYQACIPCSGKYVSTVQAMLSYLRKPSKQVYKQTQPHFAAAQL